MNTLPGTVLPLESGSLRFGFANFKPLFLATRGLTLSQVCEIAGRLFGYEHELIALASGFSIEELLARIRAAQRRLKVFRNVGMTEIVHFVKHFDGRNHDGVCTKGPGALAKPHVQVQQRFCAHGIEH